MDERLQAAESRVAPVRFCLSAGCLQPESRVASLLKCRERHFNSAKCPRHPIPLRQNHSAKKMEFLKSFQTHLGRRLKKWEAAIIAPLERMRIRKIHRRVVIIDATGHDSRQLLCSYLRWLITDVTPGACVFVSDHKKSEAVHALKYRRSRDWPQIHIAGSRRPHASRGFTFNYALLLSVDKYKPENFTLSLQSVTSVVPCDSNRWPNMIILHCRQKLPRSTLPIVYITNPDLPPPLHPPDKPHLAFLILDTGPHVQRCIAEYLAEEQGSKSPPTKRQQKRSPAPRTKS